MVSVKVLFLCSKTIVVRIIAFITIQSCLFDVYIIQEEVVERSRDQFIGSPIGLPMAVANGS